MHEMALCEGIRCIVVDQAAERNFARVKTLRLEIGALACVEKGAMEFAFDIVMRGSPAEGATLQFIDLPAKAKCFDCTSEVEVETRLDHCPKCNSAKLLPLGGDEMRIKDMEVE